MKGKSLSHLGPHKIQKHSVTKNKGIYVWYTILLGPDVNAVTDPITQMRRQEQSLPVMKERIPDLSLPMMKHE